MSALTIDTGCNYVDGSWRAAASGETYAKVNPMSSSENVGTFACSGAQDAEAAVAAAQREFEAWAALPRLRRARVSLIRSGLKTIRGSGTLPLRSDGLADRRIA
jgi:Aldehyde dehydrogenase family